MNNSKKVIALVGLIGSGKDTVADPTVAFWGHAGWGRRGDNGWRHSAWHPWSAG